MAAGLIPVPTIIPLIAKSKLVNGARKGVIDTSTPVELHSNMLDCILFYTLDGTKPDPLKKIGHVSTYQYQKPFTLPPGKQTLKAIAVLKDGSRESSVNTKVFQVAACNEESEASELTKTTWKVQDDEKVDPSQKLFKKVIKQNPDKKKEKNSERLVSDIIQKVLISSDPVSPENISNEEVLSSDIKSTSQLVNVQDLMHCFQCGKRRSDLFARFCIGCSSFLPPIPGIFNKKFNVSEFCGICGTTIDSDSKFCNSCGVSLIPSDITKSSEKNLFGKLPPKKTIICISCGSTNNKNNHECIVCDQKLDKVNSPKTSIASQTQLVCCTLCQKVNNFDAKFCNACNTPLNKAINKILNSNSENNSDYCSKCSADIPYGSRFCNICGENVLFHAKVSTQSTVVCTNCKATNSVQAKECVVCDESLNTPAETEKETEKAPKPPEYEFVICPLCKRINSADARYCDWCGAKPHTNSFTVRCDNCFNLTDAYETNCTSCKSLITTPIRKSFDDKIKNGDIKIKGNSESNADIISTINTADNSNNWCDIPVEKILKKKIRTTFTQAGEGLLKDVKISKNAEKTSPGNGYWRQQLDHIIQQLKVYTQNNIAFRDSFKNFVLSSLHSASVKQNNEEETLLFELKFGFKDEKDNKNKSNIKEDSSVQTLKNAIAGSSKEKLHPQSSQKSSPRLSISRPSSAKMKSTLDPQEKKLTKKLIDAERTAVKLGKLSPESLSALKLITSSNNADETKFEELIRSVNFDPNSVDENGIPLLKLCVLNKKFNLIQFLIDAGANIDQLSGPKENSALHESVSMGISGQDSVEILLLNKASPDLKNKKGKTPYDIAVESGIDGLISKFTKYTSNNLLKDIIKI
ncbi:double zinc ribbon and ankyrin repeat-containing protein 1 [Hydra vulgaris]|uniref:double zinc ribbon and ankyrin repeat-containing protein 1 n=1 Tax=Hydra vulgaris TaxID=6087 RepID=UPI001F5F2285|nr:double zinc ribbon and ankyrin repeat-containing protein 1 [Hydra vulgaris]